MSPVAIDVTDETFETKVLGRSHQVPVIVDLWAEWCGPCLTLGPILEKVVAATEGAVVLAKIDIDSNPRSAATFGVQSIPAVFALRDAQVVDSFIGALPEAKVAEFVAGLAPAESELDRLVAEGDEASLLAALDVDPGHPGAVVAMAQLLIDGGDPDGALDLLARIPETPEIRRLAATARLSQAGEDPSAQPDDASRLDDLLARAVADPAARQELLDLLEVMGPEDPRTNQYRRDLASRLY